MILLSRLPFNWRTVPGYFNAFCIEFGPIFYVTLFCACNMALQVGTCRLMVAFVDDVKAQLSALDKHNKKNGSSVESLKRFRNCAQLHTAAKQLS